MRIPAIMGIIGAAGLSALVTAYALHTEESDNSSSTVCREAELQQEIARLELAVANLSAYTHYSNSGSNQMAGNAPIVNASGAVQAAESPAGNMAAGDNQADAPVIMLNPTVEQNNAYARLKSRFDDPSFVRTLSLQELVNMEEMKMLPRDMQMLVLGKAMERYNRGEVDVRTFFAGTPGYQQ